MHKCPHKAKTTYCPQCVLDTTGHQGKIVDQFSRRFDYVWKKSDDEHKKIILDAELKYPLAATQVLASFPVKDDINVDEYISVIVEAVKHLAEFRKEFPNAKIRYNSESFVLYSDLI